VEPELRIVLGAGAQSKI